MLPFEKFHRLTYKIENLIISDLKKREPIKYWSFWLSDLTAKIGAFSFICAISTMIIIKYWLSSDTEVPEYFIQTLKNIIIFLAFIGVISVVIRTYFYCKLENIILEFFDKYKKINQTKYDN